MQINNTTKYGYSRLVSLFRSGINYCHYDEMVSSAVRPIVGNLPKDILNQVIKANPIDKRSAIILAQSAFINTSKVLSKMSDLIEDTASRIQINKSNIVDIVFGLENHTFKMFQDDIFKQENTKILTIAQQILFNELKKVVPQIKDIKLTFIDEGNYSNVFKCEILNSNTEKLVTDKVLKCFHHSPNPWFNLDKNCYAYLLDHPIEEILEYNEKNGRKINRTDFEQAVQNIKKNVQTTTNNSNEISQYTSKIHGACAEANVTEYIRYMSGHKLSYKDGIVLPDMYVLSETPFAISEYITSDMSASRVFDFSRLGLYHSDLNTQNMINGICFDIGGIMPVVDKAKIKKISQDKLSNGKLSLKDTFTYIEQARKSVIVGCKDATRFLKKSKNFLINQSSNLTDLKNINYKGLFPKMKSSIIDEIKNKKLFG